MKQHVVVVERRDARPTLSRQVARDGWRIFRSQQTGFEIAIPAHQIARVEAIAKRERNEWYALAVGEVHADEAGVHSVIRDFVPNEWAERGRAHVHMGADAEGRVRELARELHPCLRSVGNLHTHPRYSTRPSGTDREEFWQDAHSVSIIVDPFDSPTIAVYRGAEGEQLLEVPSLPNELRVPERPSSQSTSLSPALPLEPEKAERLEAWVFHALALASFLLNGVVLAHSIFLTISVVGISDAIVELSKAPEPVPTPVAAKAPAAGELTDEEMRQCLSPEP